jgi:hypothetical protein
VGHCFYRADPTYSVREWGALCDVVDVDAAGTSTMWNNGPSGSNMGTLTVPTALLTAPPTSGKFIAISQIGSPTLWGMATPAVSMTRHSTFSTTGTVVNNGTNYEGGDIVSFAGGTFSQQAAIYVDAVDKTTGAITQWHFLWGGLYDPASVQSFTTMAQDNAHTYCGAAATCGTTIAYGAVLAPAWSGWSVLNSQTILDAGAGYHVGDTVTLSIGPLCDPRRRGHDDGRRGRRVRLDRLRVVRTQSVQQLRNPVAEVYLGRRVGPQFQPRGLDAGALRQHHNERGNRHGVRQHHDRRRRHGGVSGNHRHTVVLLWNRRLCADQQRPSGKACKCSGHSGRVWDDPGLGHHGRPFEGSCKQ